MTTPGPYDKEAAMARIQAAQTRKNDRVHDNKTVNRQRNKQARQQRRTNRKRGN